MIIYRVTITIHDDDYKERGQYSSTTHFYGITNVLKHICEEIESEVRNTCNSLGDWKDCLDDFEDYFEFDFDGPEEEREDYNGSYRIREKYRYRLELIDELIKYIFKGEYVSTKFSYEIEKVIVEDEYEEEEVPSDHEDYIENLIMILNRSAVCFEP